MSLKRARMLLPVILPFMVPAQDTGVIMQRNGESAVSFRQFEPAFSRNGDAILAKLAAARDESPIGTRIDLDYRCFLLLKESSLTAPEITVRMTDLRITGSPDYRKFTVTDVVTPDRVACNLNLIDLPDSNILRQYRLYDMDIRQLSDGYTSTDIPVISPDTFSVTLSDICFYFSDDALGKFQERIKKIDNYFASAALTGILLQRAERFDPVTDSNLPSKYLELMETNRIVRILDGHRFGEELSLELNDPEHFEEKFIKLCKFSRSATLTFLDQLAEPSPAGWSGSLTDLSEAFISHLVSYIRKSMMMNNERGGIYHEYLERWFSVNGFDNEGKVFAELAQKMFPGKDPASAMGMISKSVCDAALRSATELIRSSDYATAVLLMQFTVKLIGQSPFRDQLPDPTPLLTEAVMGTYISFLGIAESCIGQQKWQMAGTYIRKAEEYLSEFHGMITADSMLVRVSGQLFSRQLERCDAVLESGLYREALECYHLLPGSYPPSMAGYMDEHLASRKRRIIKGLFDEDRDLVTELMKENRVDSALIIFDRACSYADMLPGDRGVSIAREELDSLMLPVRYQDLAEKGRLQYFGYNLEEAFRTFSRLKEVGEAVGMGLDTAISAMYLECYKHHILNEISMATGMIWKDEFIQAEEYAKGVESVMDLYNMETDPDLQAALRSYRRKIDLKACQNTKEESEILSVRARRNIELKKFNIAVTQLGEARGIIRQHPDCGLSSGFIDATIKRYLPAAFYQEKQIEASQQVALGNYLVALRLVGDNERFYRDSQLDQLGVPFVSPTGFIAESSRVPLYLEAIGFFLESGNIESAWNCLGRLRNENVEEKDAGAYQESVGSAMAARDFTGFPGGDPGEMISIYTKGDRWYTKFGSAYEARWKQMKSQQTEIKP